MNVRTFCLLPFPGTAGLSGVTISGGVRRSREVLSVRYDLSADAADITLPQPCGPPERRNGLWKETCFELFLAEKGVDAYREFNMSPAGHWNVYRFDAYRQGMREDTAFASLPFSVVNHRNAIVLSLEINVGTIVRSGVPVQVALSAVLASRDGVSFWALAHPGEHADFHRRDSFILEL